MATRNETDTIIIHCSYTPPQMDAGVEEIRNWHVNENGWSDIGYHFVIKRDGTIEEGRPIDAVGAHVKNHNKTSIGICLIGGKSPSMEKSEFNFSKAQMSSLETLVANLQVTYKGCRVAGHNEFSDKDCPCFSVPAWWAFGDIL